MQAQIKRILIVALGVLFIVLGIVGLALPFLQGFLFLAIGILLLSLYSPALRAWVDRRSKPYPKAHAALLKAEGWILRVIGRP